MAIVPIGYKLVQPLPLLADLPQNDATNFVRSSLRVLDNGKRLQVETVTGGYRYHFNRNIAPEKQPEALRSNVGYTYITGTKYSKQDVLQMYGGAALVAKEVEYTTKRPTALKAGGAASLLRRIHNTKQ